MKKANLGSLRRRFTSLLTALTFTVLAVTGVIAFVRPFSIHIIGLHALIGFLFIALVGVHVVNNIRPLKGYLHSRSVWVSLVITLLLAILFFRQPGPVKSILGLSANIGPAMDRFELSDSEMTFHYTPAGSYKMKLTVKTGAAYRIDNPPAAAVWLENQGGYHIKSLLVPEAAMISRLPYWNFKRKGWEKAKREAEKKAGVDIISEATPNGSFDPADYILPASKDNPMPYQLLIEIDQPDDGQPSLVYSVEVDNSDPRAFQLLDLVGYPKRENDSGDKETWALYYVDDQFSSALELINSALLTIERQDPPDAQKKSGTPKSSAFQKL
ncbi:MAG: DUF4405 domain-containing protein [Verrucomicrobiales bacterium]|nr:DUF4405 domain-containing protein [Verrucomicrobiales bacterium]